MTKRLLFPVRAAAFVLMAGTAVCQSAVWVQRNVGTAPDGNANDEGGDFRLAYDPARDVTIAVGFGNGTATGGPTQTWEFDGDSWTQITTSPNLGTEREQLVALFFNPVRQRVQAVTSLQNRGTSVWEYGGSGWNEVGGGGPAGRNNPAVAYDSARNRIVFHGGDIGATPPINTLFEFDGATWAQRSSGGPVPRTEHGAVFDAARATTIIGSGRNGSTVFYGDAWEWNGTGWTERRDAPIPARRVPVLAYDTMRGHAVLYAGLTSNGTHSRETWLWDGDTWRQLAGNGPSWNGVAIAYDDARDVFVCLLENMQTWELAVRRPAVAASFVAFGAGCAGSNGTPALDVVGEGPYIDEMLKVDILHVPTALVGGAFAMIGRPSASVPVDLGPFGMPSCALHVYPDLTLAIPREHDTARLTLSVPASEALVGQQYVLQGLVIDLGTNALGLLTSDAAEMTIGRR